MEKISETSLAFLKDKIDKRLARLTNKKREDPNKKLKWSNNNQYYRDEKKS